MRAANAALQDGHRKHGPIPATRPHKRWPNPRESGGRLAEQTVALSPGGKPAQLKLLRMEGAVFGAVAHVGNRLRALRHALVRGVRHAARR